MFDAFIKVIPLFKVLRREIEILNGPQALVELRDTIKFSISVE